MAHCRSCGEPVVWVETESRPNKPARKMPIDADPDTGRPMEVDGGNLIVIGQSVDTPIVRYVAKGRHVSHFATCPNAGEHRKAKR